MLDHNDVILDSSLDPKREKIPPAIVSFEWIFFMFLLCSQYIAMAQLTLSSGYDGIWGLLWGGGAQILLGIWQPISALVVMGMYGGKLRLAYLIAVAVLLAGSLFLFIFFGGSYIEDFLAGALVVGGHCLAWFYCVVCYLDSKKRKAALAS